MNKIGSREYRLEIKDEAANSGITTAYKLWKRIGGSKATAWEFWEGRTSQIKFETLANLCALFLYEPNDISQRVVSHDS